MRYSTRTQWLASLALALAPLGAFAQVAVGVSIRIAPPMLPVPVQPPCPTPGFLWTPGYYAYGPAGYYWVPGVWVAPPRPGLLWTPGYWAVVNGVYAWHAGYWGPHVGFYGGVNYGFGYAGVGFVGGVWAGNVFRYNTAVVSVNTAVIHTTYVDRTVVHNTVVNRVSFNGPGGITARPTPGEQAAMHEPHVAMAANQRAQQEHVAQEHGAAGRVEDRGRRAEARVRAPAAAGRPEAHAAQHESHMNHPADAERRRGEPRR